MNGFLQILESKALKKLPIWEVLALILPILNKALTEEGFAIKNYSNVNEKELFKDLIKALILFSINSNVPLFPLMCSLNSVPLQLL